MPIPKFSQGNKHKFLLLLACIFVAGGLNHFYQPAFYLKMMPPYLPAPLLLVQISGLAEIFLGALLLLPSFSFYAAWGLILLLVAVFPANVQMALTPELWPNIAPILLWLRLPLQGILIAWAYWHRRP